jgi:hypothetical protein
MEKNRLTTPLNLCQIKKKEKNRLTLAEYFAGVAKKIDTFI